MRIVLIMIISCWNAHSIDLDYETSKVKERSSRKKALNLIRPEWEKRILSLRKEFKFYASLSGRKSNFNGLTFRMVDSQIRGSKCEMKEIQLTEDFSDDVFYHEVGHCMYNYAHINEREDHIMSYHFDKGNMIHKRKESLLMYFDLSNNMILFNPKSQLEHAKMILSREGVEWKTMEDSLILDLYNGRIEHPSRPTKGE